jgi:hypothetical protein
VLKTAINCIALRSSIKGKVVHFKFNQAGKPVRARTEMKVAVQGKVYNTVCNNQDLKSKTKPVTCWRKRSELKAKTDEYFTIWKTFTGEVSSTFSTKDNLGAALTLTF